MAEQEFLYKDLTYAIPSAGSGSELRPWSTSAVSFNLLPQITPITQIGEINLCNLWLGVHLRG